ncbi:MAG: methyltransferase domain-containing protein [Calditrichaeota bacterium]|nr:MAG: methyltransferase domain-containing protein [Calditrichota bacterium]
MDEMKTHNWVIDYRGSNRANMYRLKETLISTQSKFQEILIAETFDFGRALFLDGIPQSSELDEHVYHECLIQPAMLACAKPETVFVAGGGEGANLREILRHPSVKKVIMVDIDEELVQLARQHLLTWHQGRFDDSRVYVLHEDARAFLENTRERFDCIFNDMTDPLKGSPAAFLFTKEYFELTRSRLKPGGIYAMQAETTHIGEHFAHISIIKTLQEVYQHVLPYQTWIPFYGLSWGFALASDSPLQPAFARKTLAKTLKQRRCEHLSFYDVETHQHLFSLPKYLRRALQDPKAGMIIYDDQLLEVE